MKTIEISALLFAGLLLFNPVTAEADYTIYPCPQRMRTNEGIVQLDGDLNVICEDGIDDCTRKRMESIFLLHDIKFEYSQKTVKGKTNVMLGVHGSRGIVDALARKQAVPEAVFSRSEKYDKHVIAVNGGKMPSVFIVGEHTNAVFHALATLEQMLEQGRDLQCTLIEDYSDLQYRGIVEGYYGYPYSIESKQELMRFFMRYKMNTYLYGAKSDPYHSGFWRDPYPTSITRLQETNGWLSQQMIRDLSELSLQTKVNFIWAIHPNSGKSVDFSNVANTKQATADVLEKFDLMYRLGVRQFAVFLDDAGWDLKHVDNYEHFLTGLQRGMEEKYNRNYQHASDTVKPLHYVPHIYAVDFASKADRDTYFNAIRRTPENVVVYTTGNSVWSTPMESTFKTMQEHMGRKVSLWWNYPCNDNKDGCLYTADMITNLEEMGLQKPEQAIPSDLGLVANPMQQGQVAKIGLFGIADYSWNTSAFDSRKNWENAFEAIVGKEQAPAYRHFARYVRHDDPEALGNMLEEFKKTGVAPTALTVTLDSIAWSCGEMRKLKLGVRSNQMLFNELEPWINKLEEMVAITKGFLALGLNARDSKEEQKMWCGYLELVRRSEALTRDESFQVAALEDMGENPPKEIHNVEPSERYLMAFINYMKENTFKEKTAEEDTLSGTAAKGLKVMRTISKLWISSDGMDKNINFGQNVTVNLMRPTKILGLSVSALLARTLQVEVSADARMWKKYMPSKNYAGELVKYVRFTNQQKRSVAVSFDEKTFNVLLPHAADIRKAILSEGAEVSHGYDAKYFADGNPATFCTLNRPQHAGDTYTVELEQEQPVYDVRIWMGLVNGDHIKRGHVEMSLDGKTWKTLNVQGMQTNVFTMDVEGVHPYDKTVSYCDFDGEGEKARFVRLVVDETAGWLRLHGIVVNGGKALSQQQPIIEDKSHFSADELTDGDYTTGKSFSDDWLTYRITGLKPLRQVKIYSDCGEASNATIHVSVDGENWLDKGRLNPGITAVDLSDCPNAHLMVIEFSAAPATIYEVVAK